MESDPPPDRRGPYRKGLLQRRRLLHAAAAAFEKRGADLTLSDVADVAGQSREAVRHYFPTVTDLLLALQETYDLGATDSADDGAPLPARIAAAIRTSYAARGPAALTAILTARAVIDVEGSVGRVMSDRLTRLRSGLAEAVRHAQAAGEFRDDIDPDALAQLLLAATQGLAAQMLLLGAGEDDARAARDALLRLFEPSGSATPRRPNERRSRLERGGRPTGRPAGTLDP